MYFKIKRGPADIAFSEYIRTRDQWTCQRCFIPCLDNPGYLDCSHFHSRGKKSVRFDPENAVALCKRCHDYMGQEKEPNKTDHRDFFIKRLGSKKFDLLEARANLPQKVDEKLILIWCKNELAALNKYVIGYRPKK